MAGESEVNNPPAIVPGQELSMPEIQNVHCKLKVKTKVRETKARQSKEISKMKITKEIHKVRETKAIPKVKES